MPAADVLLRAIDDTLEEHRAGPEGTEAPLCQCHTCERLRRAVLRYELAQLREADAESVSDDEAREALFALACPTWSELDPWVLVGARAWAERMLFATELTAH